MVILRGILPTKGVAKEEKGFSLIFPTRKDTDTKCWDLGDELMRNNSQILIVNSIKNFRTLLSNINFLKISKRHRVSFHETVVLNTLAQL